MQATLEQVFQRLKSRFGPQFWWPGDSAFEIVVGAVLVQNTNWNNVERALDNLRDAGLLAARSLYELPPEELEQLIRPAGYYRVKARRLRNLLGWLIDRFDGSLAHMFHTPLDVLRAELLAVSGIGPETADSILLYAGGLPTFVIDAYTTRVLVRHGWIDAEADYYRTKELFEENLPADAALFNEYHALLVRLGKEYCRKTPKCVGCPLEELLPEGGARASDER